MLQTLVLTFCIMESSWGWELSLYFFLTVFCCWVILLFVLHGAVEQCVALEPYKPIPVPQERLEFVIRSCDNPLPHHSLSVNLWQFYGTLIDNRFSQKWWEEQDLLCRMKYRIGEGKAGRGSELGNGSQGGRDHPAEHFSLFWNQSKKSQFCDG